MSTVVAQLHLNDIIRDSNYVYVEPPPIPIILPIPPISPPMNNPFPNAFIPEGCSFFPDTLVTKLVLNGGKIGEFFRCPLGTNDL
jgi:hypothetical protein